MFDKKHLSTCFTAAIFQRCLRTKGLSPLTSVLPLLAEVTGVASPHSLRNLQEFFLI